MGLSAMINDQDFDMIIRELQPDPNHIPNRTFTNSDYAATYQHSLFGSEPVTSESILKAMRSAEKQLRKGVGIKTRPLYCHPDNADALNTMCKKIDDCSDMSLVRPYRIVRSSLIPKTIERETGKVIWHDSRFIQYSDGPDPDGGLNEEEYLKMCLRWRWAHMEKEEVSVCYEIDTNSFGQALDASRILSIRNNMADRVSDSLARRSFADRHTIFKL